MKRDTVLNFFTQTMACLLGLMLMSPQYVLAEDDATEEKKEEEKEKSLWDGFNASASVYSSLLGGVAFTQRGASGEYMDDGVYTQAHPYLVNPYIDLNASYSYEFVEKISSSIGVSVTSLSSDLVHKDIKAEWTSLPEVGLSATVASYTFPSLTLFESDMFDFKTGTLSASLSTGYVFYDRYFVPKKQATQATEVNFTHVFDTLGSYPLKLFGKDATIRAEAVSVINFEFDSLDKERLKKTYSPDTYVVSMLSIKFNKLIENHSLGASFGNQIYAEEGDVVKNPAALFGRINWQRQYVTLSYVNPNYNFNTKVTLSRFHGDDWHNPFSKTTAFDVGYSLGYSF